MVDLKQLKDILESSSSNIDIFSSDPIHIRTDYTKIEK